MDSIGQELINLLRYLLPGFLSAWVYYGLTSFSLPSQFERVVQALIFTLLIQPLAYTFKALALFIGKLASLGVWSQNSELTTSVISAIVLGIAFAYFTNNDKFHRLMRFFKITRETSYPSEWFGAFDKNITYVVLHLNDGNRIYGWPTEWPSQAGSGHFLLEDSSWLDDDNNEIPMLNVKNILIPAGNVILVEFMELKNVKESA
ncbi:DUF6338 family protein [Stutzerimonas zhaodongensis]|uniref:DUF6338 family protein n=1 Tax=Stutzerimonas TaxID=2901164 RepID=UPI0038905DE6